MDSAARAPQTLRMARSTSPRGTRVARATDAEPPVSGLRLETFVDARTNCAPRSAPSKLGQPDRESRGPLPVIQATRFCLTPWGPMFRQRDDYFWTTTTSNLLGLRT